MLSNPVCNHTPDDTNQQESDFINDSYDYRPNWTPLSPITIINRLLFKNRFNLLNLMLIAKIKIVVNSFKGSCGVIN